MPPTDPTPAPSHWKRIGQLLAAFAECLPALIIAMISLRVTELHLPFAESASKDNLFPQALAADLLSMLRYAPLLFVLTLPALLVRNRTRQSVAIGAMWTIPVLLQAALVAYTSTSGVALGSDLFAYSLAEIDTTIGGSTHPGGPLLAGTLLSIMLMWLGLALRAHGDNWPTFSSRGGAIVLACAVIVLIAAPPQTRASAADAGGSAATVALNKTAFFIDDTLQHLLGHAGAPAGQSAQSRQAALRDTSYRGPDPAHPFEHTDRTPDTLGPLLPRVASPQPNIVLIIVEGLGRSFSGPDARLGSFTPFLDELAAHSLYWHNFLAPQGRTFGVLPSVLGSLPYGATGFAELPKYPPHISLPALLKEQGYSLRFYTGTDLEFDQEGSYLKSEGFTDTVSAPDFPATYQRSNDWGYGDRELVDMTLNRMRAAPQQQPALTVIQTNSMHTPYQFRGQGEYMERVDRRLDQLNTPAARRASYTAQRDIYASILYADDALRHFFTEAARLPGYENTVFLITGDHRLPELPMDTRLERYHVPLIVFSPRLKQSHSIKAVSSHFDIAPALAAWLANGYQLKTPPHVTWLGTGLDTSAEFRNLHAIPLKQTKTEFSDFVSGTVYLAQDRLFALGDGLLIEPVRDDAALAKARAQFNAFRSANDLMTRTGTLAAPSALAERQAYTPAARELRSVALAAEHGRLGVSGLHVTPGTDRITATAVIVNGAATPSPAFVPLLVLSDANGVELGESYGKAITLEPGARVQVQLELGTSKLPSGRYFASLIPSHPDTGKPVGTGQYHVEVDR